MMRRKTAAAGSWNIHHPSTPLTERERARLGTELLSFPHLSYTATHTQARLLLSNSKERRKRVHKYCNPLLFVWLCSWSHHSSHCTICRSMRTFLSPCTHQSAFAGVGGSSRFPRLPVWLTLSILQRIAAAYLWWSRSHPLSTSSWWLWRNLDERRDAEIRRTTTRLII